MRLLVAAAVAAGGRGALPGAVQCGILSGAVVQRGAACLYEEERSNEQLRHEENGISLMGRDGSQQQAGQYSCGLPCPLSVKNTSSAGWRGPPSAAVRMLPAGSLICFGRTGKTRCLCVAGNLRTVEHEPYEAGRLYGDPHAG